MTTATVNNTQPQIPPTRASLKTWWNHFAFAQRTKREADVKKDSHPPSVIFGRPLRESLKRASVQISTAGTGGELYVWGQIPVVVAKCGLYLKENATELAGTFRVSGSNKRMRDLQAAFETPPRYGKDLDWKNEQYTPHDVASVFRRYLTQMPEPVIPHDLYHPFRDALAKKPFNRDEVIQRYKRLIRMLPDDNRFLLLYVLDLLSVFARKADKNLMTAKNLAVIFRPALLSHPSHELSPPEHPLSQDVLEFLIEHQDWFMLDISPPGSGSSRRVAPPPGVEPVDMMITDPDDPSWSSGQTGRVTRRRTTSERPGEATSGGRPRDADNLAPVYESTTPPSRGESVVTVSRSRTMPSRTARNRAPPANAPPSDDDSHPKVLKKHRRTSTQPQSRPGAG
ncbi:Rho GTPase activation protein domain-containing protein [Phanerochaete sordida]|uniref:Rho GTPase activation protein domain-containing protein n=1 Tax=Phanerochaete sordida TaxID=48140 RepID=A0A9P3GGM8_9APHY|nr:Rho GTPase activation protein domain-containing protein [Phanerochaete sordida]